MRKAKSGIPGTMGRGDGGSVSIEASIALTAFLFMFIMLYSLVTICRAQAHIQIAIDSTAKEISQYSYLYGMTGLDESIGKFQASAAGDKSKVNGFIGSVSSMFEGMQTLAGDVKGTDFSNINETWGAIGDDLKSVGGDVSSIKSAIMSAARNPESVLLGMARMLASQTLTEATSRLIAEPIAKVMVQKHLKRGNSDNADAFCRSVGIVPDTYMGEKSYFNGLKFDNSRLFPDGTDEITIIVNYKVKVLPLLPIDYELSITQAAQTKGWLHGDHTKISSGSDSGDG